MSTQNTLHDYQAWLASREGERERERERERTINDKLGH